VVAWGYLSLQYQDLVELMINNRGRGNTAGAVGCPQVFIPASLELGWKLSNELMSKNWGRGNTTGAVGCPGVFIPALSTAWLDLAWFAFEEN